MHRFVEPTPVRTVDLRVVEEILMSNAKIASQEKDAQKRQQARK
jgi:hypothetical protein